MIRLKYHNVWFLMPALVGSLLVAVGARAEHPRAQAGSSGHGLWLEPGQGLRDVPLPQPGLPSKAAVTVGAVTGCTVRVAYVVPTNRVAQAQGVSNLKNALKVYQDWYRDQMVRNGFGPKTFRYEMETNGTPKVYTVGVPVRDDYLRGDLWSRTISAASAAGIPTWTSRQVWFLVPEAHLQSSNGTVVGGTALGASFGSGDDAGIAMMGGDALARYDPALLTNNLGYSGRVIPAIGPHPLVQNVSFPSFEGSTLSSVSSSVLGAGLHEMSHALGLPHDMRNDENFRGNLMGNGLRGFRGNLYPDRYPSDYTRISYAAALALNVSRYFNPVKTYTDNTGPTITVDATRTTPAAGLLELPFSAVDSSGLAAAWLALNGDLVGEMPLYGTSTNTLFRTAFYNPGAMDKFTISVFDTQGNKRSVDVSLMPKTGFNRAPRPFFKTPLRDPYVGELVQFDASGSSDPDGTTGAIRVEWDTDGDGSFDAPPSFSKTLNHTFGQPGDRLVRIRVTDAFGGQTVSTPLPIRVLPRPSLAAARVPAGIRISWPASATGLTLQATESLTPAAWVGVGVTPVIAGETWSVTLTNSFERRFFRLRR